jgi:uncharacterized repeat protein (TIGR01451 family)
MELGDGVVGSDDPVTPKLLAQKFRCGADSGDVAVGAHVCYVIIIENTSDVDAAPGITIVDKVPEDTEVFPGFTPGVPSGVDCTISERFVRCTVRKSLRAHDKIFVDILTVKTTKEGTIRNTATIDGGGDPNNPQDTQTVKTTVVRSSKKRAVGHQ